MFRDRDRSTKPVLFNVRRPQPGGYILMKQYYPYMLWNTPHRATPRVYSTLEEARTALSEYVSMNFVRSRPLQPPPGLEGYEGGFSRCLHMHADEIVARVWIQKLS